MFAIIKSGGRQVKVTPGTVVEVDRVQLNAGFTFADARAIVPYLAELGVGALYVSPILRAVPGSTHGYDVVDYGSLNPEIGDEDALLALSQALHAHGMGLIVDVVPPFEKSLMIRRSPAACVPLKVPFAFNPTGFWKNQKPCWASPLLSKRSEPK